MHSVIISIYNHEDYLVEAVLSAVRQEAVTEVLLLDDGSRDRSRALAQSLATQFSHKVRNHTPPDGGNTDAPARFNHLVQLCTNEWISILNSDDTFTPHRFDVINESCAQSPIRDISFVFGDLLLIDPRGRCQGQKRALLDPEFPIPASCDAGTMSGRPELALFSQNYIATTSNMTFTKSLHRKVGGFRRYRYCHDWDFALRASLLGTAHYVPQYLTNYRTHGGNTISENTSRVFQEVCEMFAILRADYPQYFLNTEVERWLATNYYLNH
jgi:glycosyltransferase involved in cell wall biosynthesis